MEDGRVSDEAFIFHFPHPAIDLILICVFI